MRRAWIALAMIGSLMAEDPQPVPEVAEAISKQVAALPAPEKPQVKGGVNLLISTKDDETQASVRDGMTCLHAGWDFEAYRHFVEALKRDPQCLMAHWGVAVSLLHGSDDMGVQRDAGLARMLALVDAGVGTDLEHRYVFGLSQLIAEGPDAGAAAFAAASEAYEDDPQLALLQCLMSRGGYDFAGDPTPDQERAEMKLRALIAKHPDRSYLRYSLLVIRAEAPDLSKDIGMARELCEESPEFAPYFQVLGHYAWREGLHGEAALAFGRAGDLYADWMRKSGLGPLDCAGWTKSECYRAVALASKGDYETSLAAARTVAGIKVPVERSASDGGRMLLWEGKTLPARILMRRGDKGDMALAKDLLPKQEDIAGIGNHSLAVWLLQAHSTTIGIRLALEKSDLEAARKLSEDLSRLGEGFVQTREAAMKRNEQSFWMRGFRDLEVLASESSGLLAMAGPEDGRGSAYNWFLSGRDRQIRESLMMPPVVVLPMEARIAEFQAAKEKWDEAIEVINDGLKDRPNDWELLTRLEKYQRKAGRTEAADKTSARIREVEGQ
jgi:tetratricopeptide (TPR) repeat protein